MLCANAVFYAATALFTILYVKLLYDFYDTRDVLAARATIDFDVLAHECSKHLVRSATESCLHIRVG